MSFDVVEPCNQEMTLDVTVNIPCSKALLVNESIQTEPSEDPLPEDHGLPQEASLAAASPASPSRTQLCLEAGREYDIRYDVNDTALYMTACNKERSQRFFRKGFQLFRQQTSDDCITMDQNPSRTFQGCYGLRLKRCEPSSRASQKWIQEKGTPGRKAAWKNPETGNSFDIRKADGKVWVYACSSSALSFQASILGN